MFRSVLFSALFLLCVHGEQFDPKKGGWDYCKKSCKTKEGTFVATGCRCEVKGTRSEFNMDDFMAFRQFIVSEHNYYRNLLASGNETRGFAQAVADMLVVNYDLELEYLARCYGRNFFDGAHDHCKLLQNEKKAGQNVGGSTVGPVKGLRQVTIRIKEWYEEVKLMEKDVYTKFHLLLFKGIAIGHFTSMCWGTVDSVGCAQIYSKDRKKDKFKPEAQAFSTFLICDYAAKKLKTNINVGTQPMYTQGPPCSKCPNHEKLKNCNKNFTSLCGDLEPIPTEKPYNFEGGSANKHCGKISILAFAFVVLMVL